MALALLSLLGAVALFLYGLCLIEEGLSGAIGNRLRGRFEKWMSSTGRAWLIGAGVTAAVQSSSAVTVMVVGLVDSGVIGLQQAAGLIMGANIGTTVTSWILGMAGADPSSSLARVWSPASFASIFAAAGIALHFGSGGKRFRHLVSVLEGFAILMFGMDAMCGATKPLTEVSEFAGLLADFSDPVLGILAGAAVTALVQSSSASVGMLQALCVTGAVRYETAIPVIMGQNIGTCVTALLAGAGGGVAAKRTALIHLYFNVLGTLLFLPVFLFVKNMTGASFFKTSASAPGVALLHSIFNVMTTVALFPFSGWLVWLACRSIGEDGHSGRVRSTFDMRFCSMPFTRRRTPFSRVTSSSSSGSLSSASIIRPPRES